VNKKIKREQTPDNFLAWMFDLSEERGKCLLGPLLAFNVNGVEIDLTNHMDRMVFLAIYDGGILGKNKKHAKKIGQEIHDLAEPIGRGCGFRLMQAAHNSLKIALMELENECHHEIECAWDGAGDWKW
jgi:hypothetical protein